MAEKTVASIMQRLFSAVNHMHRLNICHRDIKPENILFVNRDDNADIKLVDFGMAAKYKNKPLDSKVGTPYFIAPEVI